MHPIVRCQAEGSSANATGERVASTGESCHGKQRGQELPRGIVVPTTDLQMRSLYTEDEKTVSRNIAESDFVRRSSIAKSYFARWSIAQSDFVRWSIAKSDFARWSIAESDFVRLSISQK